MAVDSGTGGGGGGPAPVGWYTTNPSGNWYMPTKPTDATSGFFVLLVGIVLLVAVVEG